MRPRFYPTLVNDRYGDPVVFVDFLLERRAFLFDFGDIHALPTRSALRITDIFVSHAHIDHFIGFDRLLRLFVGREKPLHLYGPAEFIDRVEAKLGAYTWNLADRYRADLSIFVTEVTGPAAARRAVFRLSEGFKRREGRDLELTNGVILDEPSLRVSCAVLEHRTPCLGFVLEEKAHVNIWRNRLDELGLPVGPWLAELKQAIHEQRPDEYPICATPVDVTLPLGVLRGSVVSVTPGQKIGYITDVAHTGANQRAIVDLVSGADVLFIEAAFAKTDVDVASERAHLTTAQAGLLARKAGVQRVAPFHFSPRYAGEEARMLREVEEAFGGRSHRISAPDEPEDQREGDANED